MQPAIARRMSFADAMLIALMLLGVVAALLLVRPARAAPPIDVPREVLVFHYGWWGDPMVSGHWRHWEEVDAAARHAANITEFPAGGVYDSHDPDVLDRQLDQMRRSGITGVISSWWGQGTFEDGSLDLLAAAAPRHGLKYTAYYETLPEMAIGRDATTRVDTAVADISYLLDRHGSEAGWLKVDGHPVLFIYSRAMGQLGVDGWRLVVERLKSRPYAPLLIADVSGDLSAFEIRAAFAGIHSYVDAERTAGIHEDAIARWAARAFPATMQRWSRMIRCVTIFPGFDNRKAAKTVDPGSVTPRYGGRTLEILGAAAIAADPDWLLVTSWNEWHEGTEIEPSVEHGDRALGQLRRIAHRFLALPSRSVTISQMPRANDDHSFTDRAENAVAAKR